MNGSETAVAGASEGATRVAFTQLDPILKKLLALLTAYRAMESVGNETWVPNVKEQVEYLERLRMKMELMGPSFGPSFLIMIEYISLPLNAIFHVSEEIVDNSENAVVLSHIRRLETAAAKAMLGFVTATAATAQSINAKHSVHFLISLSKGLPQDLDTTSRTHLDDGTDCWIAIFKAMAIVVTVCPPKDLSAALQGGLVAKLADSSTTFLSSSINHAVQFEALQMMQSLLDQVKDATKLWQSLFPGVLAALFRCIIGCHRIASTAITVSLECVALRSVYMLLRNTLLPIQDAKESKATADIKSATAMLKHLIVTVNDSRDHQDTEDATSAFLSRVQQRAVTPLVLLQKQAMASRAAKVRRELLQLCQIILIQTPLCWAGTSLLEVSFECALILENDSDDGVAEASRALLLSFQHALKKSHQLLQKIESLAEELPTLSHGGKSFEIKIQLQLLKGYIRSLGPDSGFSASTFSSRPFIDLFEVDFAATSRPLRPVPVLSVEGDLAPFYESYTSKLPIHRLTLENTQLAEDVVEHVGAALGSKQGAFVVDALLSDIFEAWRVESPTLNQLKKWCGGLAVATRVLIGSFSPSRSVIEPKKLKGRRKILFSLASSVLPLLMNAPVHLWTSRTTPMDDAMPSVLQQRQGIAGMLVLILELSATFLSLLEADACELSCVILYAAIERAHAKNDSLVRETALDVIRVLARSCGHRSVSSLLAKEAARLFSEMLGRLRLRGGGVSPQSEDLTDTLEVSLCLCWILDELQNFKPRHELEDNGMDHLLSFIELGNSLVDRLDHFFLKKLISEEETHRLTTLYSSTFRHFRQFYVESDKIGTESIQEAQPSWTDLLRVFEASDESKFRESRLGEGHEGEESRGEMVASLTEKSVVGFAARVIFRLCYWLSNESLRVQISSCESLTLAFECLAMLSKVSFGSDDEEVRNSVFRQVAAAWPSIKARLSNVAEQPPEQQRPFNSLLVVASKTNGKFEECKRDTVSHNFFLARMFQLVASMFKCSGDFMADRFRSNVWPVMAPHLAKLLKSSDKGRGKVEVMAENSRIEPSSIVLASLSDCLADSQRHLIISILRCLASVFSSEESRGSALCRIHQVVGLVAMPFLGILDEAIASCAKDVIQGITAQDCDILYRPLLELSGQGISSCTLHVSSAVTVTAGDEVRRESSVPSMLQNNCGELLAYIEHLPEQEL